MIQDQVLVASKHYLIETENKFEDDPIRKEVVDAVLTVLPKKVKAGYKHLNKRDQKKIQNNLLEAFAGNPEAVRYYTISMAASIY